MEAEVHVLFDSRISIAEFTLYNSSFFFLSLLFFDTCLTVDLKASCFTFNLLEIGGLIATTFVSALIMSSETKMSAPFSSMSNLTKAVTGSLALEKASTLPHSRDFPL